MQKWYELTRFMHGRSLNQGSYGVEGGSDILEGLNFLGESLLCLEKWMDGWYSIMGLQDGWDGDKVPSPFRPCHSIPYALSRAERERTLVLAALALSVGANRQWFLGIERSDITGYRKHVIMTL